MLRLRVIRTDQRHLVGARSAALVGYRWIFVGPELSAGWASDERNGSQFGLFFGGQVRLVLGWGS